jgi:hypothetical protein
MAGISIELTFDNSILEMAGLPNRQLMDVSGKPIRFDKISMIIIQ